MVPHWAMIVVHCQLRKEVSGSGFEPSINWTRAKYFTTRPSRIRCKPAIFDGYILVWLLEFLPCVFCLVPDRGRIWILALMQFLGVMAVCSLVLHNVIFLYSLPTRLATPPVCILPESCDSWNPTCLRPLLTVWTGVRYKRPRLLSTDSQSCTSLHTQVCIIFSLSVTTLYLSEVVCTTAYSLSLLSL